MTQDMGSWALFEAPGRHPVAVCFDRGRAFNPVFKYGGTQVYSADGSPGYDIGLPIDEGDESLYAEMGLRFLMNKMLELPMPQA